MLQSKTILMNTEVIRVIVLTEATAFHIYRINPDRQRFELRVLKSIYVTAGASRSHFLSVSLDRMWQYITKCMIKCIPYTGPYTNTIEFCSSLRDHLHFRSYP